MSQRACSLMVALAVLLAAAPAYAQKKGKAKADAKGESAAEGEPAAEDAPADGEAPPADVGPVVESRDQWEAPPKDEEKPKPEVAKPQKELVTGDDKPLSVGLLLGWGFKTDRRNAQLGADPYTLGLGLRGGYTLDFNLYLGGYFVYYIGSSRTGMSATTASGTQTTHANYILFGAEVGYDWWAGPVIVRPSLGIGPAFGITDNPVLNPSGGSTVESALGFHPGISILVPFEDWFLGGDLRMNIITGNGVSSLGIFANGGLRF